MNEIEYTWKIEQVPVGFSNMFQLLILQHKIATDHVEKATVDTWLKFSVN